jgi:hypothetical protein
MANQLNLADREMEQAQSLYEIADRFGMWHQGPASNGAHYFGAEDNPFIEDGMICGNCVFWIPSGQCRIVRGNIDPEGLCKLWIIPDSDLEV